MAADRKMKGLKTPASKWISALKIHIWSAHDSSQDGILLLLLLLMNTPVQVQRIHTH